MHLPFRPTYNPGFLSDEDLIEQFCVRTGEFESIMGALRTTSSSGSPHLIVIGPRGSGKTSLLLRVAAEVRSNAALSGRLLPVALAEESYGVSTCGEFWLECLYHLADQAPPVAGIDLRRSWEDIKTTVDDETLELRSLAALTQFAAAVGKRLVLIVENLDMLFRDMMDEDAGWRLRHTLQNEPRIILLASATSRFAEIDRPDRALYDLLRSYTLEGLDTTECATLWAKVAGEAPAGDRIRPLEILTGGNPRLIAIVARFGSGLSFPELMDELLGLVDEHSEYFRSHLQALPAQERRVYLALAELWQPATTRQIAERVRIDTNRCSVCLKRLENRGVVALAGGTRRRKRYYLTERLYNIYYLLRRHQGGHHVVEALVRFMAAFYTPRRLLDLYDKVDAEARLPAGVAWWHRAALDMLAETLLEFAEATMQKASTARDERELGRAFVLGELGRFDDARSALDSLSARLADSDDQEGERTRMTASLLRTLMLLQDGSPEEALAEADRLEADIDVDGREGSERELHALAQLSRASALALMDQDSEALKILAAQPKPSLDQSPMGWALAVLSDWMAMDQDRPGAWERSLAQVVERISAHEEFPPGAMSYLVVPFMMVEPQHAIDVIEASPARDALLPLSVALRQDRGETPSVAKEVEEVAADIRAAMRIYRRRQHWAQPTSAD